MSLNNNNHMNHMNDSKLGLGNMEINYAKKWFFKRCLIFMIYRIY
jgi:hypothetical protein